MLGNRWISDLTENNEKVYNKKGINEVPTRFYNKLYDDHEEEKVKIMRKERVK